MIDYPSFATLSEIWAHAHKKYTDFPCLGTTEDEALTYREVNIKILQVQKWLRSRGITTGSKVVIYAKNQPWWGIVYLSITTMGAIAVPVLPDFHPNEVFNIIQHSEATLALFSANLAKPILRFMEEESIVLKRPPTTFETLIEECQNDVNSDFPPIPEPSPSDLASIIYTSGTTGQSKGVMLTHGNLASNVTGALPLAEIQPKDIMVSILPLSHAYECTLGFLTPLASGASIRYLGKPATATVLLPVLERYRPHLMLTVPLIMEKIYRSKIAPRIEKSSFTRALWNMPLVGDLLHRIAGGKLKKTFGGRLHFFGIGGSSLAPDVEKFLRRAGFPYAIGYGLTETSPLVAGTGAKKTKYRSTGPAMQGTQIRLADVNPETHEGEVQVKGPGVMAGYYKDDVRTNEVFTDDGWFKTGDLASMDSQGYVTIHGRIKNIILGSSGENIYPEDIEALLNQKPYVLESLVVKVGQELVAKVVINFESFQEWLGQMAKEAKDQKELVKDYLARLRDEMNHQLNKFSRLNKLVLQDEPFEKTPTLKIKRFLYQ